MPDDPLANLRDIQLPEATGWWPLAPGWWVLIALALLSPLLWHAWRVWQQRHRTPVYRGKALAELDQLQQTYSRNQDDTAFVQAVSALLKRVALQCYEPGLVASLSGRQWGEFLGRDQQPETRQFIVEAMDQAHSPQQQNDVHALYNFAQDWIKAREKF